MLYEKYFKKITKKAKRLKTLRKFRVPILLSILLLTASAIIFVAYSYCACGDFHATAHSAEE